MHDDLIEEFKDKVAWLDEQERVFHKAFKYAGGTLRHDLECKLGYIDKDRQRFMRIINDLSEENK